MSDFQIDWEREDRTGATEAVLCESKSVSQIEAIVQHASELGRRLLLTRLDEKQYLALGRIVRESLEFDVVSRTAILGGTDALPCARVAIVCGGTSDMPVAREAERTLAFHGEAATLVSDVGVAGLWRLLEKIDVIRMHHAVIAIAGMEGALFSVIAGLVSCPVIAVPSSVGYGVGKEGRVALQAALATCSPGVVAVNIDNGYGAAHAVLRMIRLRA